ncbi:ABC transporter ATP-binding protein [Rhodococcus fascians]|nr:ABC transporter ATP-binding protein [Rhodococcus fascians]MBY4238743.1 ABC transporter ATP-binding protein [Rhodococcus fascians]MBY4254668.1 ABC transporter ATP-binding protein [Rhodococcus fascians]MBY4270098.1 ABC transporter ATP-binding protein [Rhodococcus fascians]
MLEINDLHVSYGKVTAVAGISLTALPGQVTLVLGANGAGKTSTLRAAAGLLPIESGSVVLDGVDVTGLPSHRMVAKGMALVPEGRQVFGSLTVEENLTIGGYTADRAAAAKTLTKVHEMFPILHDRRKGLAGLLSGGEQQMLAFGRALMGQPSVILMDEPSMGLAPAVVAIVLRHARSIADAGIAVVMVEQNADAGLEVADSVVTVRRGEIAFSGSAAEARNDKALIRAFLGESALTN